MSLIGVRVAGMQIDEIVDFICRGVSLVYVGL